MARRQAAKLKTRWGKGSPGPVAWLLAGLLAAALARPPAAWAHTGAPYLVLLEKPVGPYLASALADPDVGHGTFYVLLSLPPEEAAPPGTAVTLWVTPQDGHLAAVAYAAERRETRYGERYVAEVPFDAEGDWQVRLAIDGPAGQGETAFAVEVTPAGINWLTTAACLLPFAVAALIWLRATLRRRA